MLQKIQSRKFLLAVAAFLASFGSGVAGFASGNEALMVTGGVCCALSAGIYGACEAYVDGKGAAANTTATSITASTTAKEVVVNALNKE